MLLSNGRCCLKFPQISTKFVKIELYAHCILDFEATKGVDLLPFFERSMDKVPAQKNCVSLNMFILSKNAVIQCQLHFKRILHIFQTKSTFENLGPVNFGIFDFKVWFVSYYQNYCSALFCWLTNPLISYSFLLQLLEKQSSSIQSQVVSDFPRV